MVLRKIAVTGWNYPRNLIPNILTLYMTKLRPGWGQGKLFGKSHHLMRGRAGISTYVFRFLDQSMAPLPLHLLSQWFEAIWDPSALLSPDMKKKKYSREWGLLGAVAFLSTVVFKINTLFCPEIKKNKCTIFRDNISEAPWITGNDTDATTSI